MIGTGVWNDHIHSVGQWFPDIFIRILFENILESHFQTKKVSSLFRPLSTEPWSIHQSKIFALCALENFTKSMKAEVNSTSQLSF
jgi:hypothetical protein